jgi:hypothetical protein
MAIKVQGITVIDDGRNIINGIGASFTGIVTATTFSGSGANLTSIPNSGLSNSSVNYGGVTLALGGSDATPAFNLSDATNYPTSSLSGTITNDQLAGSIADGKLASTFLKNVVEDTTPQLGGNLDFNSKFITGTGGINVSGVVTTTKLHVGVDTGFYNEDLVVTGDTRITGILTIGTASITLDPNAKTLTGLEELQIGSGTTAITIKKNSTTGDITFEDRSGKEASVGIGTTVSIKTTGIITATTFSGSGANLTSIPNGALTNSSIAIGGVTLNLGDTDATPAFNLSDATAYPTSSLVGTITNAQLAGSIADGKLASTFLKNVVEDTTPQLGGNLDINGKFITGTGGLNVSGVVTATSLNVTDKLTTTGIGISIANGAGNTAYIEGPSEIWIDPHPFGVGTTSGSVRIRGDLYVDGTEFIVDVNKIELGDFNIGIASTVSTNSLLDGAGLGIGATGIRKTITWNNSTSALMSSENWNLASGKHYEIAGTDVLTSDTLGSGIINSSLTSVGTLGALTVSGNVNANGNIIGDGATNISGINSVTATLFHGSGANLTSIPNGALTNSSIAIGGVTLNLGDTDATPAFNLSDATAYPTSSLVGTITNAQLAGSIANAKLANSTMSVGGVTLTLGATDATPAFDLSDATAYPYTSLTGITTEIVGDTSPQLGGNLDFNSKFITGTGGINVSGVVTATSFSGSGTNLTGLTGASAATYGDSSATPVIVVNSDGKITGISTVSISGGGSGGGSIGIQSAGSLIGTASTINFTAGSVSVSNDIASVSVGSSIRFVGARMYNDDYSVTASGSWTSVTNFDGTSIDTNSFANTTNGRFTIPAGVSKVKISTNVRAIANGNTNNQWATYKNGSLLNVINGGFNIDLDGTSGYNNPGTFGQTAIISVVEGDYFNLRYFVSSTSLDVDLWYQIEVVEGSLLGHYFASTNVTNADNITVQANNSTNEIVYPVFVDGATGVQGPETDTGLMYNPSTGILSTTTFSGNLPTTDLTGTITNAQLAGSIADGKLASTFLKNVVEDTTPQLGGNLDINGKFITGTGGLNVSGVVTATKLHVGVDTGFHTEDLVVTGDARITGILTIGTGSITLDPNAKTITGVDEIEIGTGDDRIKLKKSSRGNIEFVDKDNKSIGGIGTESRINTSGIITATTFSGSGANLTSIPNGALTNSSIAIGGVTLNLGASDATPAFNLSDATAYPTSSLTGTITNAQLAGSIADGKLASTFLKNVVEDTTPQLGGNLDFNSKFITGTGGINVSGVVTATTFSGNLPTTDLTGTITNAQLAGSIANAKLTNDSVSFGGVSLDLGGSDATPAFNLSDATDYPTSSLSGTITNAQLAGSIADAKLASTFLKNVVEDTTPQLGGNLDFNSKFITGTGGINVSGVVTATTFSGNLPTTDLTGTITNAQLAGSIANGKLANSSIAIGGVTLNLGDTDATPAFDLSDATAYPYTSLTGITTEIVGDTTPQLGGNLDLNSKFITGTGGINVTGVVTATSFSGSGSALTGLTGASAATYGDASNVSQIVVDANGRITGISNVTISGGGGGVTTGKAIAMAMVFG